METTRTDDDKTRWRDLTPLIAPRSVAIVGASQRGADTKLAREPRGNRVIRNLKNFGFDGRIVAVNPKYSEVMGCPCYPDIASIPEPVDCVVSAVPNRHVPDLLESAADAGVRAAVVFAAGFAEIGGEGKVRQARLEALSNERGFLICGPNCYGVLNVHGKAPLFASAIPPGFLAGSVPPSPSSGSSWRRRRGMWSMSGIGRFSTMQGTSTIWIMPLARSRPAEGVKSFVASCWHLLAPSLTCLARDEIQFVRQSTIS